MPGLVVRQNGFSLGTAELAYGLPPTNGNALASPDGSTQDKDINLFGLLR